MMFLYASGKEAQTYRVSSTKYMLRIQCLVEGCLGGASNRTNLWVHFAHLHAQDTIIILEDGNWPYPWCPKYDMFVSHKSLNIQHLTTTFWRMGEERKLIRLTEE